MKEPLLLTFCSAAAATAAAEVSESTNSDGDCDGNCSKFPTTKTTLNQTKVDLELYEGIVSQPIIEPTVSKASES